MEQPNGLDFNELLESTGIDAPVIKNTGEAFEFYKHCLGKYSGIVGRVNIDYVDGEGKKVEKGTPGSKRKDFGMLGILITHSPDNHGFAPDFKIKEGQVYGEFIFNVFLTLKEDRQWQNKQFFDTFKIAGAPATDVVVITGAGKADYNINLNALGFYIGAPVTFELKQGTKNVYLVDLTLTDNLLTKAIFDKRKAHVDSLYTSLDALRKKEEEERKSKQAKTEDDKALSGVAGNSESEVNDIMESSGFNPNEYE